MGNVVHEPDIIIQQWAMRNLIQKLALVTLNYISMKLLLFHFD